MFWGSECGEVPPTDSSTWVVIESLSLTSLSVFLGLAVSDGGGWALKPSISECISVGSGGF